MGTLTHTQEAGLGLGCSPAAEHLPSMHSSVSIRSTEKERREEGEGHKEARFLQYSDEAL